MRRENGFLLMAFLAGAAAGAAAGYFMNTEKGRQLWAEWKEKARKAKDSVLQEMEALERMMDESGNTDKT